MITYAYVRGRRYVMKVMQKSLSNSLFPSNLKANAADSNYDEVTKRKVLEILVPKKNFL